MDRKHFSVDYLIVQTLSYDFGGCSDFDLANKSFSPLVHSRYPRLSLTKVKMATLGTPEPSEAVSMQR